MFTELVQIAFDKIMQTRSYTVVIMSAPEKKFAIYTEPSIGKLLQLYLTDTEKPRPMTHDLIDMMLKGYQVRVKQIVIVDVQDTVYYARIFLEQNFESFRHIVEIDARPSDCLTLAIMNNAPVFCTRDVLDKVVAVEES